MVYKTNKGQTKLDTVQGSTHGSGMDSAGNDSNMNNLISQGGSSIL